MIDIGEVEHLVSRAGGTGTEASANVENGQVRHRIDFRLSTETNATPLQLLGFDGIALSQIARLQTASEPSDALFRSPMLTVPAASE